MFLFQVLFRRSGDCSLRRLGRMFVVGISLSTVAIAQEAPVITTQPQSRTVSVGQTTTFSVVASGDPSPTYQWYWNDTAFTDASGEGWTGWTTATLTTGALQMSDAGSLKVVVSNSAGSVTSNAVTLTMQSPPTISSQPVSRTVVAGQTTSFSVSATGTPAPSYQWYFNDTAFTDATSSAGWTGWNTPTLTTTALGPSDAGSFKVVVSNGAGSLTSNTVTLTVNTAPTISVQPVNRTASVGASTTFSVTASGNPAPTYQWYWNDTASTDATGDGWTGWTTSTLSTNALDMGDAGSVKVVVSNSAGSVTSNAVTLTMQSPPTISSQPVSRTVVAGQATSFSVSATGTPAPSYQWHFNDAAFTDATSSAGWTGWNTPTLTTTALGPSDAGSLKVVVSNGAGSLTSNTVTLTVNTAPTISVQPVNRTVSSGATTTFSVTASGSPAPTYQWYWNDTALTDATGDGWTGWTTSTLSTNALDMGDAGSVKVVVSNSAGSVTSDAASLTVTPPPSAPVIVTHPSDISVVLGRSATFSVEVSSSTHPPPSYQWKRNGVNIAGATLSNLTIPSVSEADAGSFTVYVANSEGPVTSQAAELRVVSGEIDGDTLRIHGISYPVSATRRSEAPAGRHILAGDDDRTSGSDAVIVPSGADVEYIASRSKRIRLVPGFQANAGSRFVARLADAAPPEIISAGERVVWKNEPIHPYKIIATNDPTAFFDLALPDGLSRNGDMITGAPTVAGEHYSSLQAENQYGKGASKTLKWKIFTIGSTTDTDGDGIPDDIEAQLGTDRNVINTISAGNPADLKLHKPQP